MSVTARQLIYSACRLLGYSKQGMTVPPDLEADGLIALNNMIESWNLDKLMIYTELISTYTLTPNQYIYTIGPTASDFVTTRPLSIEQANIILNTVQPVLRKPLNIITYREWSNIAVQDIPAAYPNVLYYDRGFDTGGDGKIYMWPGPYASYNLELYTWQQLTQFANISTTSYSFPPGYEKALRYGLAVEMFPLAPDKFKIGAFNVVDKQARKARQAIEDYNALPTYMTTDAGFQSQNRPRGGWNYLTGGMGNAPGTF
jgi:hypothetical protein